MNRQVTSNDDGVNLPVLRYADILLMASEIANSLGELDNAKSYLKQVRQRAFNQSDWNTEVTDYMNKITSQDQMLSAIQKERMLEFPGEMLRKQDLIRWNILGKNVKETVTKMKALRDRSEEHTSELQSPDHLVCRLLLEKKNKEDWLRSMKTEIGNWNSMGDVDMLI